VTDGDDTRDAVVLPFPGRTGLGDPEPMAHDDEPPPPAGDLSAYRRVRQERASDAMIEMFAGVLGKPLVRRELTPHEQALREARLRERGRVTG
jgi:hypothetical protein